ncbi:hypothetical protein [Bradyrhizobium sp. 141]|uniref:hypothetical protein n=1 Tax=Bradyrhizobium sp. 141 TaxID=2782617 RepID=UPI00320AD25A|nr:hypothetical protein [Bradyrhizobium sp. 141]
MDHRRASALPFARALTSMRVLISFSTAPLDERCRQSLNKCGLKDADEKRDALGFRPHVDRRLVAGQGERADFGRAAGFACSANCLAAAREHQEFQDSAGGFRQRGVTIRRRSAGTEFGGRLRWLQRRGRH